MGFISETQKIRETAMPYMGGLVLDIGCGQDIIKPDAFGIDAREFPHTKLVTNSLYDLDKQLPHLVGKCDAVFSSHCLEHLPDDIKALKDWGVMLKSGGVMFLYLPCDTKYENSKNPEHLNIYTALSFCRDIESKLLDEFTLCEYGNDYGDDRYSFYIVMVKK